MITDIKAALRGAEQRTYDADEIDDLLSDLRSEIKELEDEVSDLQDLLKDAEAQLDLMGQEKRK